MNNARRGLVISVIYMAVNHFVHPIYLNTQIFSKYLVGKDLLTSIRFRKL